MESKVCRKCGKELPLDEFYTHSRMADGHLNICKECVRARVSDHREKNLERIREYDRQRASLPHRKAQRRKIVDKRRKEDEAFNTAHTTLHNFIRDGKVIKGLLCQLCGSSEGIEGHHFDYSDPLGVIWLCKVCHRQYHMGKSDRANIVKTIVDNIIRLKEFSS